MANTFDPNSFREEEEAQEETQELTPEAERTEETETPETVEPPKVPEEIDYKTKFSASAQEAIRLAKKNKELEEALAAKDKEELETPQETDSLYPGFENLDEEAQENLVKYTNAVTERAKKELEKDPAIAFARESYAQNKWDTAFNAVHSEFPDLDANEFKSKYYDPTNVPDNISDLLTHLAKAELYDKAKDLGKEEAIEETKERVEIEQVGGGEKSSTTKRSLAEWNRLAAQNPAKFAQLSEEYDADLKSGELEE